MANPAPKIINFNFNYLIVSVRRPSHICASFSLSFFVLMFVTGLFCQRHCSHDSPADVVFSRFPRFSVPVCCSVRCMCMCMCMCIMYVYMCLCLCLYLYLYRYMYMYMYLFMSMFMFMSMSVCICISICVWSVSGKMVNAPWAGQSQEKLSWRLQEILPRKSFVILFFMGAKDKSNHLTAGSLQRFPRITGA